MNLATKGWISGGGLSLATRGVLASQGEPSLYVIMIGGAIGSGEATASFYPMYLIYADGGADASGAAAIAGSADALRNSHILEEAIKRPIRVSASLRLRYTVSSCRKLSGSLKRGALYTGDNDGDV